MRTQTKASLTTFIDKRSHKRQISAWVYNGQRARVRRTSQLLGEAGSRSGDRQKSVQGSNRGRLGCETAELPNRRGEVDPALKRGACKPC